MASVLQTSSPAWRTVGTRLEAAGRTGSPDGYWALQSLRRSLGLNPPKPGRLSSDSPGTGVKRAFWKTERCPKDSGSDRCTGPRRQTCVSQARGLRGPRVPACALPCGRPSLAAISSQLRGTVGARTFATCGFCKAPVSVCALRDPGLRPVSWRGRGVVGGTAGWPTASADRQGGHAEPRESQRSLRCCLCDPVEREPRARAVCVLLTGPRPESSFWKAT